MIYGNCIKHKSHVFIITLKMIPDTELEFVFILFFLELGEITAI